MVRRIVHQNNFQSRPVREFNHPPHELRAKAGIFRTIVQVDDQLPNVSVTISIGIPPLLEAIGDEIARFL